MKIGSSSVAIEAIKKHKNIIIFHHVRPDGDCLGSQHGLAQMIKDNFPDKNVFTPGDNNDTYNFMNYQFDPVEIIDFNDSLAIVVDASSSDRIQNGDLLLTDKFTAKLRIDHHPNGSDVEYDYLFVDEHYVAAAEQVAQIAFDAGWKVSEKAAKHTFLGIVTDSGRFMYADTSPRTYRLAAFLQEQGGIDPSQLHRELARRTVKDIKYSGYILSNFKKQGRVLYFLATKAVQEEFGFNDLKAAVSVNELANIEDNACWAFFVEQSDGSVRCRLRSNGPLVNEVANKYEGGGHANAAGCTIKSFDEVDQVVRELNDAITRWEAK
ncbi:DHH family phosphoesterase [Mycoplasma zalophidermidis]|uniref:Bifunctional oligoribonuclease/PAP phosphatase NrnA n=1 Tax=Mycoplasma zalophidermidis TaxID=398174 RepID=A0ABS6DRY6_9MOLU|nr:bifunctional oligoribonuclease/PAP phosphatase NrnA [Mycoplasma zalophidermidis]MBU4689931.1 bifunctional oligoribonuclease/PAP phosphatase NrnA [Mycoplasma zalophidermidis]MBU4693778.1 bifunctional oligoribonuclease/PAP phosphatase NrnA [Mycoplasma zalophidermidis]MCR8966784.1 bifunctional oligoribonuclease/PAP phosphatase NrnA [Mycoplasma zalophidermidis]